MNFINSLELENKSKYLLIVHSIGYFIYAFISQEYYFFLFIGLFLFYLVVLKLIRKLKIFLFFELLLSFLLIIYYIILYYIDYSNNN